MTETVDAPARADAAPPASGGNGVGIASFVTACLGLGPVAVVLGLLGLARWRDGRAARRSWPLAGLVVGVIGTIAAVVGAFVLATSDGAAAVVDEHAKVDVITVGNALVDYYAADPTAVEVPVAVTAEGYEVGGVAFPAALSVDGGRDLALEAESALQWCVALDYAGGAAESVSYSSTGGLVADCFQAS